MGSIFLCSTGLVRMLVYMFFTFSVFVSSLLVSYDMVRIFAYCARLTLASKRRPPGNASRQPRRGLEARGEGSAEGLAGVGEKV